MGILAALVELIKYILGLFRRDTVVPDPPATPVLGDAVQEQVGAEVVVTKSPPENPTIFKIAKVEGEKLPTGEVKTRNPKGLSFKIVWSALTRWHDLIVAACEKYDVPIARIYGHMLIESQGDPKAVQKNNQNGWSYGPLQAVPRWHMALIQRIAGRSFANESEAGNYLLEHTDVAIEVGVAILRMYYDQHKDWDKASSSFFTGKPGWIGADTVNGTQGGDYKRTLNQAIAEFESAATVEEEPTQPSAPITFLKVPHPPYQDRRISNNRAWDDLGPRNIAGSCRHSMIGSLSGTDQFFRGDAAKTALTDYGIGGSTDGSLDGVIYMWNDPRGRRAPWANGPANDLEGDGQAFVNKKGVNGINRDLVSIERSDGGNTETPMSEKQFESMAQLIAYWADQAEIPWDKFPAHPQLGIVTDMEHWEFGPKECPFTPVRSRTTQIQDRVRAILKQHQTGSSDPTQPPVENPPPGNGWPAGMDLSLATALFGQFTMPDGSKVGFDPSNKGIVSATWLSRGDAGNEFPQADKVIISGDVRYYLFNNGWCLAYTPKNEKRNYFWVGEEEGEISG